MKNLNLKVILLLSLFYSMGFSQTLKIVYNESTPPLKFTDTNKNPNGILIDIWKFWALKNNIEIEFIESSWDESLSMIQDGRADIHAGLYYTKSRDDTLDYSSRVLYKNKNYFFYNKKVLDPKSINDLKAFVIGLGNGYSNPYMKENHKNIFTKTYKTDDALSRAFIDGEVNVALSSMATMTYFIKKNKYDMNQYKYSDMMHAYTKNYFGAVKQGNKKVLDIINSGFEKITNKELETIEKKWTVYLNENYLKDYHNKHIALTQTQTKYLINKKEIKMCVDPSWFPFESIEEGKHKGIIADIFAELQKHISIPITLVPTKTWSQSLEYVKRRNCDILAGAARTPLRDEYLNFTQPYLKFPEVIVTREQEPFIENFESIIDKKIGIVKNSAIIELVRKKYPNINLVGVKSVPEGLMQVNQGKLYGFLNTSASISYYISKEGMTNLKIATKVGIDYHLSTAVRNDDEELLRIFNKIISNIEESKIQEIKDNWLKIKVQEIIDYSIIYKTIAFFLFIIAVILYWNRKLNREIEERIKIEKQLNISFEKLELSNKRIKNIMKISDTQAKSLIITNEKLKLLQEEATKANGAKSEFLAKMSHEIRTPMNAVIGMLYLLEKTEVNAIQENYIKKASYAANSLLGIINDILDFSKIEAGKLDITHADFEFNDMIMNVLSVMSFQAEQKELELLAYYDPMIPSFIVSDRLRIEQILTNLLSNAVKFTNKGEILISTKLIKQSKANIEIMFCVKDNGIGISKSSQEKLFQEFTQVDDSATRSFHGTGLGLAICKKLSNLLGGDIWIEESKELVGSTFCFTIKCTKSNQKKEKKHKNIKIQNLKCLVVDDSSSAVEVLTAMLHSFNYDVKSASCGKDAIAMIKNELFDIVFLDYQMDGLNGIETYEIVKNDLQKNNTKTIMVSSYSKEIVNKNIHLLGIDGYLGKPISPSLLYDKIYEIQNTTDIQIKPFYTKELVKYFGGVKVLLVEDNPLNQEFAMQILKDRGFIVEIASDGIEALAKIKNKTYDIILMDIQMPHMDGLEATKHIRSMNTEYCKNIPIIALSANALLGDKEKSIEAGMNNHINKPINPQELFDVLALYVHSEEKVLHNDEIQQNDDYDLEQLDLRIFDVENTLAKLNNSHEIYIKILKQFGTTYKNVYDELQKFLDIKDLESLKVKVHELKGVTGNIGATILYEKLVIIDKIIKKDEIPSFQLLQEFKAELKEVMQSIEMLQSKKIERKSFHKDKVISLLELLTLNLEEDIVKCETILNDVIPYLSNTYKEFGDNLTHSLDDFDTDRARALIEEFLNNIEDKND
ncbi:MAG: transporter substrate-binding domain-containing protein [Arcobacteraceae bacterium]